MKCIIKNFLTRTLLIGFLVQWSCTNALANTFVWNGGTGIWNSTTQWAPSAVPGTGTTADSVFIDNGNPANSQVTFDVLNATIVGLTVDPGDSLTLASGNSLTLDTVSQTSPTSLNIGGQLTIAQGGQLTDFSAPFTLSNGAVVNNRGGLSLIADSDIQGVINNSGWMLVKLSMLVENNGTLINTGGISIGQSGSLVVDGDFTNSGGIYAVESGFSVSGNFNNLGSINFARSSLGVGGDLNNLGTIQVAVLRGVGASGGLNNMGTIHVEQSGGISAGGLFQNSGTLTIESGYGYAGAFHNTGDVSIGATVNNFAGFAGLFVRGDYIQTSGSTQMNTQITQMIGSTEIQTLGGSVQILGGTLSGGGSIIGDVLMNGRLELSLTPSILSITGNYSQTANGTFLDGIGGLSTGTQYSQLQVSQNAMLNGILSLVLTNGFTPQIGQNFTIMDYGALTGTFSSVQGLNFAPGLMFVLNYNPNDLTLSVAQTPEPGSLILLTTGLAGLAGLRRSKKAPSRA